MEWFLKISNSIKHGRVLSFIRPLLDVLFIFGISYALYCKCYGTPQLPEQFNLQAILLYFLNGNFIVPFAIVFMVWGSSTLVFELLFEAPNYLLSESLKAKILKVSFGEVFGTFENEAERNTHFGFAEYKGVNWIFLIYEKIKDTLSSRKIKEINQRLRDAKRDFSSSFATLCRSIIAVIIYFKQVPEFGWLLFVYILITQFIVMLFLVLGYQLAVLIPILSSKVSSDYKTYKNQEKLINPQTE